MLRRLILALAFCLGLATPALAQAPEHVKLELVSAQTAAAPGQTLQLALRQSIEPNWHTYWRNPGDTGQAPVLTWSSLPEGWRASGFTWPAPKLVPVEFLMQYGYQGEVILPFTVDVPASARPGQAQLAGRVDLLVCDLVCVPQSSDVVISLPISPRSSPDPRWAGPIQAAIDAAPRTGRGLTASVAQDGDRLRLTVLGPEAASIRTPVYFFPQLGGVIDHAAPQGAICGPQGVSFELKPASLAGGPPTQLSGVLMLGETAYDITALPGEAAPVGGQACALPPALVQIAVPASPAASPANIWAALIGALIGGLILNLMPCVFPILSMKAAALSVHAHQPAQARLQGLAFLAGCVATFLALGAALLLLRAAGGQIGWGFQLQSPAVVAALALVMLTVALNLSGLFEIGLSAQGAGSSLASRGGAVGAFFTGALAVVAAAPCTAPFMAAALGFAITASAPLAMMVFAMLAVGFAAPFVMLSFAPRVLARMPRPGPWMDIFKKALAFPMYAAAAWLLWVLVQQTGAQDLARFLAAALTLAFGLWLAGLAQTRGGRIKAAVSIAALVAACALAVVPAYAPPARAAPAEGALPSEPWSEARVRQGVAAGQPVFVDFTAAWCVTCQVNERAALASEKVAAAFKAADAVYLKADWTNHDADIADALARYGRAGVPLYLVYGESGTAPEILPQLLTEGMVIRALEKAAG